MAAAPAELRRAQPLLGTFVEIAASGAPGDVEAAIEAAFGTIARVRRLMSFHEPESDVSRLNRAAGANAVAVDPWTFEVLEAAVDLGRRSAGAFDVSVAPVLQAMGRLPRHGDGESAELAPGRGPAIELMAGHTVRLRDARVRIDLGGIAKGYAVDRAVAVLVQCGAAQGVVNAGGDLKVFGPRPQAIHLRDPRDPRVILDRVEIARGALASSGGRADPVHSWQADTPCVIDPSRATPADTIAGASVMAASCMIADALTKIVMIRGEAAGALLAELGAAALLVSAEGQVSASRDWPGAASHAA